MLDGMSASFTLFVTDVLSTMIHSRERWRLAIELTLPNVTGGTRNAKLYDRMSPVLEHVDTRGRPD